MLFLQLLMNFIAEIVGSYWLALIFQTSHVISEVCIWSYPQATLRFLVLHATCIPISCTLRWNGQNQIKIMLYIWTGK